MIYLTTERSLQDLSYLLKENVHPLTHGLSPATILIDRSVKNQKKEAQAYFMSRTPRKVEDRREQIIDAAMRVFAQKGFVRASNRDVAQEAGITTGLIYYYFESKEDLLRAVLEARSPVQVITQITPEVLEQPPDVLLPVLVMRVLDLVESEPFISMLRVLLPELLHGSAEVAPITLGYFQRVLAFLNQYLQTQTDRGRLRADLNTETAVQTLAGSMIGMVMRRQILRDPSVLSLTHEEIAQAIVGTLLLGIAMP
jgi:AcrR family transcriptional regulator